MTLVQTEDPTLNKESCTCSGKDYLKNAFDAYKQFRKHKNEDVFKTDITEAFYTPLTNGLDPAKLRDIEITDSYIIEDIGISDVEFHVGIGAIAKAAKPHIKFKMDHDIDYAKKGSDTPCYKITIYLKQ
jgi:hypothetical protein